MKQLPVDPEVGVLTLESVCLTSDPPTMLPDNRRVWDLAFGGTASVPSHAAMPTLLARASTAACITVTTFTQPGVTAYAFAVYCNAIVQPRGLLTWNTTLIANCRWRSKPSR